MEHNFIIDNVIKLGDKIILSDQETLFLEQLIYKYISSKNNEQKNNYLLSIDKIINSKTNHILNNDKNDNNYSISIKEKINEYKSLLLSIKINLPLLETKTNEEKKEFIREIFYKLSVIKSNYYELISYYEEIVENSIDEKINELNKQISDLEEDNVTNQTDIIKSATMKTRYNKLTFNINKITKEINKNKKQIIKKTKVIEKTNKFLNNLFKKIIYTLFVSIIGFTFSFSINPLNLINHLMFIIVFNVPVVGYYGVKRLLLDYNIITIKINNIHIKELEYYRKKQMEHNFQVESDLEKIDLIMGKKEEKIRINNQRIEVLQNLLFLYINQKRNIELEKDNTYLSNIGKQFIK